MMMFRQLCVCLWVEKPRHFISRSLHGKEFRRHIFKSQWTKLPQSSSFRHIRNFSSSEVGGVKLELLKSDVQLTSSRWSRPLVFSFLWLRDHCRCERCYNQTTKQRELDLLSIPMDIRPKQCRLDEGKLQVLWSDDHKSNFPLQWLEENSYPILLSAKQNRNITLWDGSEVSKFNIAHVENDIYLTSNSGLFELVKSLVTYGVGFVEKVPACVEATQEVVERLSHVHRTFFGDMWEFSDKMDHSDTAYTKQYLGVHNDNTYLTEAAGLQVFHCLGHDGTGGETLLVDGFKAAKIFKQTNPEGYDLLRTTPIESEYIEPGKHYVSTEPVIKHCPLTGDVFQIRFNLYDRAPLRTIPSDKIATFYKELRNFAAEIRRPELEWKLKLRPGTVVFIDNWRVLHGREAYTGHRRMCGCYVGRADFLSKARVLGLL